MVVAFNESVFDLYKLFVTDMVGTETSVFMVLSFLVIAYFAAKFRFPNVITVSMFAVYSILMGIFFQSILAITLFLVGILFAWGLSRLQTRG